MLLFFQSITLTAMVGLYALVDAEDLLETSPNSPSPAIVSSADCGNESAPPESTVRLYETPVFSSLL